MAIYEAVFPDEERESRAVLERYFSLTGAEHTGGYQVLAAVDRSGAGVVGGIVFSYLSGVNCGYISYLMVAAEARRRGIGTALFRASREALDSVARRTECPGAEGVFTELRKRSDRHPGTLERVRFWTRLEVIPLAVDWEYPELEPGKQPARMDLAYAPFTPRRLTFGMLGRAVREIFATTYSYLPTSEAVLTRVAAGIESRTPDLPVPYRRPEIGSGPGAPA